MIQPDPNPATLLSGVIEIVREAGASIREEFHCPGGPRGSGSKAKIDEEVEADLVQALLRLHPCPFQGEETRQDPITDGDLWIVDPNDGTRDFLQRRRGSAISVALLRKRRPVLGVVFAPVAPDDRGDLIAWAEGAVLTRNGEPIKADKVDMAEKRHIHPVVALNADAADYARHNHTALAGFRVRAIPSPAYRLALAAAGEVDVAMSLTPGLARWDIAGGHALLIGAGLPLTDRRGKAIDYTRNGFDGCLGGEAELVRGLAGRSLGGGRSVPRRPARPKRPIPDADRLARAQGCLLGQLAGDALGSAVEFQSAADIRRAHPDGVTRLTDGGTWDLIAGQPTDDSEMTLALARTLVEKDGFDAEAVGRAYVTWMASKPFDIGNTTRSGIAAIAAGREAAGDSQSNGALMRVSPIGIFATGDPTKAARLAAEDARLTHPHPVCRAASAAYAAAIAVGIAGGTAGDMRAAALAHAGDGEGARAVRDRIAQANDAAPADFQSKMGWVLTALQNAFHHLMQGTPLATALTATVGRGGDTDTNAAICGALLGAVQGREAVPLQWRNAILTCRPVKAAGVRHPRPMTYWPDDALDLAEALLAAGKAALPGGRPQTGPKQGAARARRPDDPPTVRNADPAATPFEGTPSMTDFDSLNDQARAILQIKLDGYIEAGVMAARAHNIGLSEALSLTIAAVLREAAAHAVPIDKIEGMWRAAVNGIPGTIGSAGGATRTLN